MKAQSKNRKSPTCSRCRFHGERDVRVLQHKCPFKDCACSDCLVVKKRSNIYRAQKNLDKSDENSNEVSSPGSGSTGSSRCLGSPQIPMHPGNMGDSNEPSLQNPWSTNHQQPPPPPQLQQAAPQQQLQQQLQHQQPPVAPPPSSLVAPPPPPPHQMPPTSMNSIPPNKNIGYSNIKNFHELCLTFPEHSPPQLQTIFEQCGNDYEKTIDKILMTPYYCESLAPSNDYQQQQQQQQSLSNDPNYLNNHNNHNNINKNMNHNNNTNSTTTNNHNSSNHNHNHNHNHNTNHNNNINSNNTNHNNLEYPPTNEDDTRLSFANCHYNQQQQPQPQPQQPPSQRMMTAPNFNNQDYTGDELVNRSIQPHNTDAMASDWSYGDTNRYSMATTNYPNNNNNNTWTQGDYPNWSNASSNFWPSNGHTNYSYVDQNDANAMTYYYGSRREMDYPDPSGHLDRTVKPEIGPNISSNYDFDAY